VNVNILYQRMLSHGPSVRIRLTSEPGASPATGVLEIERRTSTVHKQATGLPPRLAEATADSPDGVLAILKPYALDDAVVARLLHQNGVGADAEGPAFR
jgi:hypothetical protein